MIGNRADKEFNDRRLHNTALKRAVRLLSSNSQNTIQNQFNVKDRQVLSILLGVFQIVKSYDNAIAIWNGAVVANGPPVNHKFYDAKRRERSTPPSYGRSTRARIIAKITPSQ